MHGVQPKANATPTSIAPSGPAGLRCGCTRFSVSRNASRNTPIVCRPKMISTPPAILLRSGSCANMNLPTAVADAPSAMNTIEKPITNASEVMNTWSRDVAGGASAAHLVHRHAGDERDVAGDQRQDAGGDERQEARRERREQRDVPVQSIFCSRIAADGIDVGIRPPVELHRRQVLEHDVPFPALGRVRRLQPVLRRDRARERQVRQRRVRGIAGHARAPRRRARARCCV